MPAADPLVDRCIECGFCEPACPSNGLSLTPRQRRQLWRRINHLQRSGEAPAELGSHQSQYRYLGIDTCAATGMCATRCPVGINTGTLMKQLKGASPRPMRALGSRPYASAHRWRAAGPGRAPARAKTAGNRRCKPLNRSLHHTFKTIPIVPLGAARRLPHAVGAGASRWCTFVSCVNRTLAEGRRRRQRGGTHAEPVPPRPALPPATRTIWIRCAASRLTQKRRRRRRAGQQPDRQGAAGPPATMAASPVYIDNGPCAERLITASASRVDARSSCTTPPAFWEFIAHG